MEYINHPAHYQRKDGIECIDIIRHYTCDIANAIKYLWRAGLKVPSKQEQCDARIDIAEREEARPIGQTEMGKEDAEKEIEDLKKALWYIEDFLSLDKEGYIGDDAVIRDCERLKEFPLDDIVLQITGYSIEQITKGYPKEIQSALNGLLQVGIIKNGTVVGSGLMCSNSFAAIEHIQQRILDIECSLTEKELKETVDVLHGQAVDGMDYVSKPGGVRETEPEKYDPLNMIVAWGRVYSLTDEVRKKDNGAIYSPCENCDLWSQCHEWQGMPTPMLAESPCHYLCARIHGANDQQYYKEVGVAKYSPKFGTVEVVDEHKEMQLELKRLEDEGI